MALAESHRTSDRRSSCRGWAVGDTPNDTRKGLEQDTDNGEK